MLSQPFGGAVGSLQFDQQQIYGGIKHSSQQRARHTSIRKLTSTALLLPHVNMSLKARQDLAILQNITQFYNVFDQYVHLLMSSPKIADNKAHFIFTQARHGIFFPMFLTSFRRPDRTLHYRSYISLSVLEGQNSRTTFG